MALETLRFDGITKTDEENGPVQPSGLKARHGRRESIGEGSGSQGSHSSIRLSEISVF